MTIRQKQAEIWEELLLLETRVQCQLLLQYLNDLETFITPNIYVPVINNQSNALFRNQHRKIVQETKRSCIKVAFNIYEVKIQKYEQLYRNE